MKTVTKMMLVAFTVIAATSTLDAHRGGVYRGNCGNRVGYVYRQPVMVAPRVIVAPPVVVPMPVANPYAYGNYGYNNYGGGYGYYGNGFRGGYYGARGGYIAGRSSHGYCR